ncbi:MAG: hypothetical protein JSW25_00625, partial [Thermoplasmata archaeon]
MGAKGISLIVLVLLAVGPLYQISNSPAVESLTEPFLIEQHVDTPIPQAGLKMMLSDLDGNFIENKGQVGNKDVHFYAQGDPLSIGLTNFGVLFTLFT